MTQPANCDRPLCLADREVKEAVLATKVNGIIGLCLVAVGLLSYSVLWQAPNIRKEFACEVNRLDKQDTKMQTDVDALKQRVSVLEEGK